MSEPTNDGNQKPDPDPPPGPDQSRGENQEQSSGSVFNDPTAPVWADPTAPIPASPAPQLPSASAQDTPPLPPAPPAPPGGAYSPYGQQPAEAPQPTPPPAPPMSNPYAQLPPTDPYGQPAGQYDQPAGKYGQQQPGQPYPAYGQSPYASGGPAPSNTSAIILTILSALSLWNILAAAPLVLGIIALTKNSTDPEGSRRFTKIGWIVFVVVWVLVIVVFGLIVLGAFFLSPTSTFDNGF